MFLVKAKTIICRIFFNQNLRTVKKLEAIYKGGELIFWMCLFY